jgi:hypothetical protein
MVRLSVALINVNVLFEWSSWTVTIYATSWCLAQRLPHSTA